MIDCSVLDPASSAIVGGAVAGGAIVNNLDDALKNDTLAQAAEGIGLSAPDTNHPIISLSRDDSSGAAFSVLTSAGNAQEFLISWRPLRKAGWVIAASSRICICGRCSYVVDLLKSSCDLRGLHVLETLPYTKLKYI